MENFEPYNVVVVGTGYVGLVTGTCLAHIGHAVTCVDIDEAKVARMRAGEVPIYEPGLAPLVAEGIAEKRLQFTTDLQAAISTADVVFLALPTPPAADGAADLSAVLSVARQLSGMLKNRLVIVTKSTVPVGTGDKIREILDEQAAGNYALVSNPEFLREGMAVEDCLHPDRIVVGSEDTDAFKLIQRLYAPYVTSAEQIVEMDVKSAEMTKYAANSFLAMKVSFINEVANLCEKVGADVESVRRGIGPDERIGRKFLQAGIGYGGSCFPKDVEALIHTSNEHDYSFSLLESIVTVNQRQKLRLLDKLMAHYGGTLSGKKFALWGLAFKPDTDDIRESAALKLLDKLLPLGAQVVAYDPHAVSVTQKQLGDRPGLTYAKSASEALTGADALLLVTEWDEFKQFDLSTMKDLLAQPVVFDGRNVYDPTEMKRLGFHYEPIGRPTVG